MRTMRTRAHARAYNANGGNADSERANTRLFFVFTQRVAIAVVAAAAAVAVVAAVSAVNRVLLARHYDTHNFCEHARAHALG